MKVIRVSAVELIVLTSSCRPHADARPTSVPSDASLVPSLQPPSTHLWVSCIPVPDAPRTFTCFFFHQSSGQRLATGVFRLVQGDASGNPFPPPSSDLSRAVKPTPAVAPSALQLRSFDGWILRAQPPWFLLRQGTPPFHSDPPPSATTPPIQRPA